MVIKCLLVREMWLRIKGRQSMKFANESDVKCMSVDVSPVKNPDSSCFKRSICVLFAILVKFWLSHCTQGTSNNIFFWMNPFPPKKETLSETIGTPGFFVFFVLNLTPRTWGESVNLEVGWATWIGRSSSRIGTTCPWMVGNRRGPTYCWGLKRSKEIEKWSSWE